MSKVFKFCPTKIILGVILFVNPVSGYASPSMKRRGASSS